MPELKRHAPSLFARAALALAAMAVAGAALAEPEVSLKTTMGEIAIDLNHEAAPKTVDNFLRYVKSGFYKGTVFHRVIDGFMIQGGGLTDKLVQKPTNKPIPNESKNGLSNQPYTISMAREDHPDSATSQFFINVGDNSGLDYPGPKGNGGYTVFGKVVKGQDVVDKIAKVVVDDIHGLQNVPVTPVVIKSASVIKSSEAVK
ncbi:peptidylprolyl isomerase [Massilia solisilvae]|uniref:Peptidyl-prolyl cis-trans isomerase n=1 Tax=Massilia solisilvae TaxID=1811225 RepID=A0ABT2BR64_9BURK|nr:peptidylprolyl isomerase [Massilia solisilvae]MCS0610891.1 peptidylprolyl isomerase [Massilia solisilvae]